jgi:CubicO group peptidase (beta-lactamase class C family)
MGLLVDQLVRRVDPKRRSLSTFFQEEVAGPFGIDFYIGLPKVQNHRTARVVPADILKWDTIAATRYWNLNYAMIFDSGSLISKTLQNPAELAEMNALLNNPLFREVPVASLNGFGTGSSMAKLMGILGNGGHVKGQRLLKPESIRHLGTVIMNGTDMVLMSEVAFGPGTLIHKATHQDNIFGHAGLGGQIAYADPALKLGWSYLTNHFSIYGFGDAPTTMELQRAMYDCAFKLQENDS